MTLGAARQRRAFFLITIRRRSQRLPYRPTHDDFQGIIRQGPLHALASSQGARVHPSARARLSGAANCARCRYRLTPQEADGRANRRRLSDEQKRVIVLETEKPGVAVAEVCRRHGVATSLLFRWRAQFGLTARKATQLATVALTDGTENAVAALAALRDLVKEPDRGTDFTKAAADPRGVRTNTASWTTRESKIAGASAAEVAMPPSVRAIGLTASYSFEPDSRLITIAELDTCRLQGSS